MCRRPPEAVSACSGRPVPELSQGAARVLDVEPSNEISALRRMHRDACDELVKLRALLKGSFVLTEAEARSLYRISEAIDGCGKIGWQSSDQHTIDNILIRAGFNMADLAENSYACSTCLDVGKFLDEHALLQACDCLAADTASFQISAREYRKLRSMP